ncbi:TonB-dependent receptor plug domain-containing protein [Undibacterium squillarum]|nr:TonB-dependent receptor [Undibacterium squillarum]
MLNPPLNQRMLPLMIAISAAYGALPATVLAQEVQQTEKTSEKTQEKTAEKPPARTPDKARALRKNSQPADGVQKVTISGGRTDVEERRQSTAAKMIFGREELDRNGDSTIGEVLKRLPGVTTGGRAGRGGDIRMRGMGNGYTQILINGERAPRGFSMDSLSPDQVERIEIVRGAVAEFSTQAIAGTINIVLREEYKQKNTEIKAALASEQGRLAPNVSVSVPGEIGNLSYALNITVSRNKQHDEVQTDSDEKNTAGVDTLVQRQRDVTHRETKSINMSPRFNYRFDNGDTLMFQPFLMMSRSESGVDSVVDQIYRAPDYFGPAGFATATSSVSAENRFIRGFGNWQHRFADGAKLTVRFGGGLARMDSNSQRFQFDRAGNLLDLITDVNNTRDKSLNNSGKWLQPFGESHTIAAGWELEGSQRSQVRTSLDNGKPQYADSGDNLDAGTRRLALYVQDEFDITPQLGAYAGLRWEGIKTHSTSSGRVVDNTSKVWSPVLHGVWRIPETKDQVRLSFASTYRAPALNDLIAIPSISNQNSATRPDRTGNPALKPELSRGVDLAYEHYLSRAGVMSVNVFIRSIDDLIRRRTVLTDTATGPRWVSSPVNIGHAVTKGIEADAKFPLQEYFPDGPAIDVRANYSRYWSSVDDIQGPNNRLDSQPSQTANFGLDYRVSGIPLTLGGNFNWTPAYYTQSSNTQLLYSGVKRQLDVFALWKFSPTMQLRLSANNLSPRDAISSNTVTTGGIYREDDTVARTFTTFSLRFEMKI